MINPIPLIVCTAFTDAADQAVSVGGKTAGLIADYGMLVMVGALFLIAAASALWMVIKFYNRKIGGEYVLRSDAVAVAKTLRPDLFRPEPKDLPHLLNHRFFPAATKCMRSAEAACSSDNVQDLMIRDLTVWTLRAYRDSFHDIIEAAYANKDGFNEYLGNASALRTRIDVAYTELSSAVRYRLVEEYTFPVRIFDRWITWREESDRMMIDVMDLAMAHPDAYWQLHTVLDSLYARCVMLRSHVVSFFHNMPADIRDSVTYVPMIAAETTLPPGYMVARTGPNPAALFDRKRNIR